jgi:PAS domain-containing protein
MSVIQQRLALALEAAQLGAWTWDIAGTTEWDARLEELHGLPAGGFGGTFEDWLAALHPEDRSGPVCAAAPNDVERWLGPLHRVSRNGFGRR